MFSGSQACVSQAVGGESKHLRPLQMPARTLFGGRESRTLHWRLTILMPTATAYLDNLNPEQRCAVKHGAGPGPCPPLLVIAGAGSGRTNTLAHRVAHPIVAGADPR